MGWSIGYDDEWKRDIGYGVPAICDHPGCDKKIDRGLSYVCGSEPYGGEHGCGLFFCREHLWHREPSGTNRIVMNCKRCKTYRLPYKPKPDTPEWINHKLTDPTWQSWREENPGEVAAMRRNGPHGNG